MKNLYLKYLLLCLIILNEATAAEEVDAESKVLLQTLDYAAHYEIMINAPPEDVWPYTLDLELWLPFKVVHIEGEKNKPGELKYITTDKGKSLYLKILNIIPFKQYSEKYGVNRDGVGSGTYGHFSLTELDGKTKLNLNVFAQETIAPTPKEDIDALRTNYVKQYLEMAEIHMRRLKHLVEEE